MLYESLNKNFTRTKELMRRRLPVAILSGAQVSTCVCFVGNRMTFAGDYYTVAL